MRPVCPICQTPLSWHHARNVTRKEGRAHSILSACDHFAEVRNWKPVPDAERPSAEVRITEHAERLFATYTAGPMWTDASRHAYKNRIWPGADSPESTGEPWEAFSWVKDARSRLRTLPGLALTQTDDCPY